MSRLADICLTFRGSLVLCHIFTRLFFVDQTLRSSQMKDTLEKLEELEDLKTKLKKQQATEHKSLEELTNKLQTETKGEEFSHLFYPFSLKI